MIRTRPGAYGTSRHLGPDWTSLAAMLALLSGLATRPAAATPADLQFRGLLDLAVSGRGPAFDSNAFFRGDSPFDAWGLRLFVEGDAAPRVHVFTQMMFDDATSVHVDGAYVMLTPRPDRDLHLLAGKLPWLVGTWAPRTYSNKNPLIGVPLLYQHHTSLVWYDFAPSADVQLAAAGTGQVSVNYGYWGTRGMAIVDDSFWDFGATVTGSFRPFEGAIGFTNGTPGWPSTSQEENDGKTVLARIGATPHPTLRLGVSGAYGPYLLSALDPQLPAGHRAEDYHQKLRMGDAEFTLGHVEVRAEGFLNTWQTPQLGDLDVHGGYLEGKLTLLPGLHAAARWDVMRFSDLADSSGARHTWDHDVARTEVGLGYHATREILAKLVLQRTTNYVRAPGQRDRPDDLVGAQLSITF
jgi:hypothetical protein